MAQAVCMACGGILGRDCFNEQDCMMILQSQASYGQQMEQSQIGEAYASLCDFIGVEAREVDPIEGARLWNESDFKGLVRMMHDRYFSAIKRSDSEKVEPNA